MRKAICSIVFVLITCISFGQDSAWRLSGNAGTTSAHFLGTTDGRPLFFKVNNSLSGWIDNGIGNNTTFGFQAGSSINAGLNNTLVGFRAGRNLTAGQHNTGIGHSALYTTTTGTSNTASGYAALYSNAAGSYNTATGMNSLYSNTTGSNNTASGFNALRSNTIGVDNTAAGYRALYTSTVGNYNTAFGVNALFSNSAGHNNVALGHRAMFFNTTGGSNTAMGVAALFRNSTGSRNVAIGFEAHYSNATGFGNVVIGNRALNSSNGSTYCVAIGDSAMYENPSSNGNTAVGAKTLMGGIFSEYNTAVGYAALRKNLTIENTVVGALAMTENLFGWGNTVSGYLAMNRGVRGNRNTVMGYSALTSNETIWVDANVAIGFHAGTNDAESMRYNTLVGPWTEFQQPGIHDTCTNSTALGNGALITSSNQVRIGNANIASIGGFQDWTNFSDSRFKKNVQQNVPGLDFILQLNPVTYHLDVTGLNNWFSSGDTTRPRDENAIREKENQLMTGFLAQEVEAVAKKMNYHFSGIDIPKNENGLYGLRYAQFVIPLVKSVQEQQQMIKDQQKLIDTLNQQNVELQQQLQQIRIKLGMETIITKSGQ